MNKKVYPIGAGALLILGFVITVGSNIFGSSYQQVIAQPQPLQQQAPNVRGGLLTYADSVCAIRIQYPSSWLAAGFGSDGARFTIPKTTDGLSIKIYPLSSSSPSLDIHARNIIDSFRGLDPNLQLISSRKITFAGNPALILDYRYRDPINEQEDEITRTMDISTVKGGKLYTLSYSAPQAEYPRYISTINNMISTFAIGNPTSACRPDPAVFGSLVGPSGGLGGALAAVPGGIAPGDPSLSAGGGIAPGDPGLGGIAPEDPSLSAGGGIAPGN